jgi:hypothetical protein
MTTNPERMSLDDLVSMFDEDVRPRILEVWEDPRTAGIVVYENQDFWSSQFGARTAMAVGPERTYTLEQALAGNLGNLPSNFQYPTCYAVKERA